MAADIFSKADAIGFLGNKRLLMFGDSNMRAVYKDITWLLEKGTLIPMDNLKTKNEPSHAGDRRLSNGPLSASRNYVEVREYNKGCLIRFDFITRLFSPRFRKTVLKLKTQPDFIIINSCVWDLSRWGPGGVGQYKMDVEKTMEFLRRNCSTSRIIFTTTLPPSFNAHGGFLTENIKFIRDTLPFNVLEANHYTAAISKKYEIDIIDLHYYLRFSVDLRRQDGIHWEPIAIRYITNLILTHLSGATLSKLPENVSSSYQYNINSYNNDQNNNHYSRCPSRSNPIVKTNNICVNVCNSDEDVRQKRQRSVTYTNMYNPSLCDDNYYSVTYTNMYNPSLCDDNYYQQMYDFDTT